jgi:hypothetical protein
MCQEPQDLNEEFSKTPVLSKEDTALCVFIFCALILMRLFAGIGMFCYKENYLQSMNSIGL